MKKGTILLLIFIQTIAFSQTNVKEKFINEIIKNTTCIFEGSIIKDSKSFRDKNGNIFTLVKIKVEKCNFGKTESSEVLIAKQGGTIGMRQEISPGTFFISDYNTFFLNNDYTVINAETNKKYFLFNCVAYDKEFTIIGNEKIPFKNFNEFYVALSKKIKISYNTKPIKNKVK